MGTLDVRVLGDEQSCRDTANQLTSLAEGLTQGGTAFHTARTESESLWTGQAGDAFRNRLQPIGAKVDDVADQSHAAGQALQGFADDLATVTSRMNQARTVATAAGLRVDDNVIYEPAPLPALQGPAVLGTQPAATPEYLAAQQNYQRQRAVYQEAAQTVHEARTIEQNAHNTLNQKMNAFQAILKDANDQKCWLAVSNTTGPLGVAIEQADKWGAIAKTRANQLDMLKKLIGETDDPYREAVAARAAGVFEQTAEQAAHDATSNAKLTLGLRGTTLGKLLSANFGRFAEEGSNLAKIAEKIPFVGAAVAIGQTVYDSRHANNFGDIAQAVTADMGGFFAGTAATEGGLAAAAAVGMAGAPVTIAVVGIGATVTFGTGEVVNHWGGITHDVGAAAKSVGHFFGSIF